MNGNTEEALEVLREVWSARASPPRTSRKPAAPQVLQRMTDVGFDGLAEETDGDMRLAWRTS